MDIGRFKEVVKESFLRDIIGVVKGEQQAISLRSIRDAVVGAVSRLEGGLKETQSMMVWTAII